MELEPESRAADHGYEALAQSLALSGTWEDDRPGPQSIPAHRCATLGQLHNHSETRSDQQDVDDRGAYLTRQMMGIKGFTMCYLSKAAQMTTNLGGWGLKSKKFPVS